VVAPSVTWGISNPVQPAQACIQARNEDAPAREGNDVIREACKWSPELAVACELWKEIKFEFEQWILSLIIWGWSFEVSLNFEFPDNCYNLKLIGWGHVWIQTNWKIQLRHWSVPDLSGSADSASSLSETNPPLALWLHRFSSTDKIQDAYIQNLFQEKPDVGFANHDR